MLRFAFGLLIAPLAPFVVYIAFFYGLTSLTGNQGRGMSVAAFFVVIVAFAYTITLVVWLPLIFWLERRRVRAARYYVLMGALMFLVAVLAYYFWAAGFGAIAEGWLLALIAVGGGAIYGMCYWIATYWNPLRTVA
jgi:drug/metabolite transporter (DMT)-like permease